ncbi:MAG: TonB-dependent receptor [Gammaproteobacteria bacterium]|nr:TonB-dependent receptor [Gammaproteobacteria bacterium]
MPSRTDPAVTVRVHYPLRGRNARLVLRAEPDWLTDVEPVRVSGDDALHEFALSVEDSHRYCKPVLLENGQIRWAAGSNTLLLARARTARDVFPHFDEDSRCSECELRELSDAAGRTHRYRAFYPAGYYENPLRRYPVLYMQDGQNLFFPGEAFGGQHWRIAETLGVLEAMNAIEPVIVVGIYPNQREYDYTRPGYEEYGRFLVETLKPAIDAEYRTLTGPRNTAVMGSSLGGLVSPTEFDAGGLRSGQTSVNFDAQREFDFGIGDSSIAFGGEWRNENYKIVAGEEASFIAGPFTFSNGAPPGAQVFPGFQPSTEVDASRDSFAAYVEIDNDFSDSFNVQVAGRYEHFSDFGDTLNGKIAARFEPVDGIAFRGALSTGFRAPGLAQQFFSTTSTNNVGGQLIEIGTFPVGSPIAVALGAQPLEPEESVNISGGVVFTLLDGLNLTVDYYNIKINDRIVLTENLVGADVEQLLRDAMVVGTSARFFINGIDTRTEGLDVVASYRVPDFGVGRLTLTAGFNTNENTITDRRAFPNFNANRLFARQESLRLTDGQPSNKLNLGLNWENEPFGLTINANRFGEVLIPDGVTTATTDGQPVTVTNPQIRNDIRVAAGDARGDFDLTPKWVVDLEVRYNPVEFIQLAVGANNLFDEYPDRLPFGTVNGVNFGVNNSFLPYSSQSPFGFSGRFLYGRVSVEF